MGLNEISILCPSSYLCPVVTLINMEHKEEAQQVNAKIAGIDAVTEYFERYERRREGEEEAVEGKMDYWLSEEEQEGGNQLKLRKWKSRSKKEPYVVQHAKAPKLRPAEGMLGWRLPIQWLMHSPRRPEEIAMGSQPRHCKFYSGIPGTI
jgi:hypothetical protein